MEATFWDRAAAWGYDCLGFQALYMIASKMAPEGFLASFFLFLVFFAGYIAYNVFFESRFGATLGKFAVGIGVEAASSERANPEGGDAVNKSVKKSPSRQNLNLSVSKSLERQLCAGLSWLTLNVGHLIALHRKDKKMLHDIVSGTRVIKKEIQSTLPLQNMSEYHCRK